MKQQTILSGQGKNYEWSKDHVYVKSSLDLCEGRLTLVEDTLKPGFHLGRHHHKEMTEIFYILEGTVDLSSTTSKSPPAQAPPSACPPACGTRSAALADLNDGRVRRVDTLS